MSAKRYYVGLDIATNSGFALWDVVRQRGEVCEIKGDPIEQTQRILWLTEFINEPVFVLEAMHYFRNAKTVRSLLERYGYIKYSLISRGYAVEEVAPLVARKYLGVEGKTGAFNYMLPFFKGTHLSNNHTDALAIALYQANQDGFALDENRFLIKGE